MQRTHSARNELLQLGAPLVLPAPSSAPRARVVTDLLLLCQHHLRVAQPAPQLDTARPYSNTHASAIQLPFAVEFIAAA
jgi:hypothetical protein